MFTLNKDFVQTTMDRTVQPQRSDRIIICLLPVTKVVSTRSINRVCPLSAFVCSVFVCYPPHVCIQWHGTHCFSASHLHLSSSFLLLHPTQHKQVSSIFLPFWLSGFRGDSYYIHRPRYLSWNVLLCTKLDCTSILYKQSMWDTTLPELQQPPTLSDDTFELDTILSPLSSLRP